jgi:hypothetical protein
MSKSKEEAISCSRELKKLMNSKYWKKRNKKRKKKKWTYNQNIPNSSIIHRKRLELWDSFKQSKTSLRDSIKYRGELQR